jgi:hypothetical protein
MGSAGERRDGRRGAAGAAGQIMLASVGDASACRPGPADDRLSSRASVTVALARTSASPWRSRSVTTLCCFRSEFGRAEGWTLPPGSGVWLMGLTGARPRHVRNNQPSDPWVGWCRWSESGRGGHQPRHAPTSRPWRSGTSTTPRWPPGWASGLRALAAWTVSAVGIGLPRGGSGDRWVAVDAGAEERRRGR